MQHKKMIEKLKAGQVVDLPWRANSGKQIGFRVWVDNANNAVFTEVDSGLNDDVIPLQDEVAINEKIEYYLKQGYGDE